MSEGHLLAVEVVPESFERTPRGPITGEIWFVLEGQPFPEERWSDFPVVVLEWWLEAEFDLWKGARRSGVLRFMDGPFAVRVHAVGSGHCEVECVELGVDSTGVGVKEVPKASADRVDLLGLVQSTRVAASAAIDEARKRGWDDDDDLTRLMQLFDEGQQLVHGTDG